MRKMRLIILMGLLAAGLSGVCDAQGNTRWRGPTADGIYQEQGLLKEWPVGGPEILWSFEGLGQGHSSAVVFGKNLYITGMIDSQGYLFKFDLEGNLVFKTAYGKEYTDSYYGTRGSPVVAGDRVYICSGYGVVYCLRETDGKQVWSADMVSKYGGKVIRWGHNETVNIDGDVLYCTPGGKKNNVIALNRQNGSLIWSSTGTGELSAYCTPLLFMHGGRKILATHTASSFQGLDASTGKLLWKHAHPNQWSVHANTPIYYDGGLLYFSGYGRGAAKLELNADGSETTLAWKNEKFDSRMGGAVLLDGYLYASGDNARDWKCLDWKTGKQTCTSKAIAKGNVIYADGMLYCYTERGELALVPADKDKFEPVSVTKVQKGSEQHWAHTMIHDGVLYLRHGKALMAYKIK